MMRRLLILLLSLPAVVLANVAVPLAQAPINPHDTASIQRGAATFVNYCLNCHGAQYMRYGKLQEIGLTEDIIKRNLMFTADKIGEPMTVALRPDEAKRWFGVNPPDLSVIARSRGADWLYSYLRAFYRDDSRPSGWNNLVFPQVGMPHVLYTLQGQQVLETETSKGEGGHETHVSRLVLEKKGALSPDQYDTLVADLVNFLVYMGEPVRNERVRLGMFVMFFLGVLFVLTYFLKREYWKDVH
jgi:ubiquinol-cytochrome c reductase cytochrome c1 subunit